MIDELKTNNESNYFQQSVFIEGDSLYRLIDPQGKSAYVHPYEFTNLLADVRKAEQSLDPKMLSAAKITFDLAGQAFQINDQDFRPLPNSPFKTPPPKSTSEAPPSHFEKQAQEIIGSNSRIKHLLFNENSSPNFRELKRTDYDKIFVTFQFDNTTSSLILDRKNEKAYFFDPLPAKNARREKLIFGLKLHFRPRLLNIYLKTFTNESAHTGNSRETEDLILKFYKNMIEDYDAQGFFAAADITQPVESQPAASRSFIPTYGDGNCGLHAFGETVTVGNNPQYRWIDGNPKKLLQQALQKPIQDENMQILFKDAQRDYCERHGLDPSSNNIKDRYLASLNDSSEYTGLSEILLFAKFVAKKNVSIEGIDGTYNFGFKETIPIRHIPNKENPKLRHWERIS